MVGDLIPRNDQTRINAALAAAGAGGILCIVAPRVSTYRDVALGWSAVAALLLPMALVPLGFDPAWFPGVADSWEGAHLASRDVVIGRALSAYAVLQAAIFVTIFLLLSTRGGRRWATPGPVRRLRVRRAAIRQFQTHGLHHGSGRGGLLIFVAQEDRQAEIVVSQGLLKAAPLQAWGDVGADLARALAAGRGAEGLETAIAACAELMILHAPMDGVEHGVPSGRLILL